MSQSGLRHLSEEQLLSFIINGFLVVEDVLSPDEVKVLSDRTDMIAAGEADHIPETSLQLEQVFREGEKPVENQVLSTRKLFDIAVYDPVMWQHVVHPKIVAIISDLLGSNDIKLYGDQLFMKPPEVGTEVPWHQDSASWRDIFPMELVSAWTAIDEATEDNGCLSYIPGTHRWGMMHKDKVNWFLSEFGSDQWPIIPAPLKPGSISFHHSLTLHHTCANLSGKRRRGYSVHYMRATSRKDETVTDAPKMPPFKQVSGRSFEDCV